MFRFHDIWATSAVNALTPYKLPTSVKATNLVLGICDEFPTFLFKFILSYLNMSVVHSTI